jgi:trigger factor
MEFKLEEKKGCVNKYSYSMKWDEVQEPYASIVDEVKKEAELPGFRKGKAPVELVRTKFATPIGSQLKEKMLRTVADKISGDEKLDLFANPFADEPELKLGESLAGVIYFELQPEVPEVETGNIEIEVSKREVSKEQIDSIIESFRQRNATIKTVEEGLVEEGDFCSAKLQKEGSEESKEVFLHCHGTSEDIFEKSLCGKGSKDIFELTVPEGTKHEAGNYKVSLEKIIRQALPALDEEFAVKCGFESLAGLTEEAGKQASHANQDMQKEERNDKILAALLDKAVFDVPPTLVENQLRREIEKLAGELQRRKIDPEKANIDWDKLIDAKKPEVEKSVRAYFLISKLVEKENVKVSDGETDAVIEDIAKKEGAPAEKVRKMLEEHHQLDDIKFRLAQEKIFDILAGRVKINFVDSKAKNEEGGGNADTDSR